jgi:hypothetical protein
MPGLYWKKVNNNFAISYVTFFNIIAKKRDNRKELEKGYWQHRLSISSPLLQYLGNISSRNYRVSSLTCSSSSRTWLVVPHTKFPEQAPRTGSYGQASWTIPRSRLHEQAPRTSSRTGSTDKFTNRLHGQIHWEAPRTHSPDDVTDRLHGQFPQLAPLKSSQERFQRQASRIGFTGWLPLQTSRTGSTDRLHSGALQTGLGIRMSPSNWNKKSVHQSTSKKCLTWKCI